MKILGFTIEARSSTKNPADGIFGNDRHCTTRISTDVAWAAPLPTSLMALPIGGSVPKKPAPWRTKSTMETPN
jgi:hypothetical protein